MSNVRLSFKLTSCYLSVMLSGVVLASCNSGSTVSSAQVATLGAGSSVDKSTVAAVNTVTTVQNPALSSPYSTAVVKKMIPMKLFNSYDNFQVALGGAAISGVNPDATLDVFLDTGSTILVIPEYYVNMAKVKVLKSCVVDYWGNVDDLLQGQIALKSTDQSVSYAVESYIFYGVRTNTNQCQSTVGGTPTNQYSPYFTPGELHQRQLIMGAGTRLLNPTYDSKKYCVGGFFNFLDYSKYSSTKQAIFSVVSFGNALSTPPSPEDQVPYSMQSYISVGLPSLGPGYNYSPMLNAPADQSSSCPSNVYNSWEYWDRSPASITADGISLKLPLVQTPTGSESAASTVPYASVDTGGGSLGMMDAPGNPNLNALAAKDDLNPPYPTSGVSCYNIKPGLSIKVKLTSMSGNAPNTYGYKVLPSSWGAYQAGICVNGANVSFNTGFPLFYAASTVSFDFTKQRIAISLAQINPPVNLPLPNFFCATWQSTYGVNVGYNWGITPPSSVIQNFWSAYNCDARILHPEWYLFH